MRQSTSLFASAPVLQRCEMSWVADWPWWEIEPVLSELPRLLSPPPNCESTIMMMIVRMVPPIPIPLPPMPPRPPSLPSLPSLPGASTVTWLVSIWLFSLKLMSTSTVVVATLAVAKAGCDQVMSSRSRRPRARVRLLTDPASGEGLPGRLSTRHGPDRRRDEQRARVAAEPPGPRGVPRLSQDATESRDGAKHQCDRQRKGLGRKPSAQGSGHPDHDGEQVRHRRRDRHCRRREDQGEQIRGDLDCASPVAPPHLIARS